MQNLTMWNKRFLVLCCLTVLCVLTFGCGPKRPAGMPDLVPVTIHITQNNQPLNDVEITLISKGNSKGWFIFGRTNELGDAVISTLNKYPGAPKDEYIVLLKKTVVDGYDEYMKTASTSSGKNLDKEFPIFSLIDPKFNEEAQSPFKITVKGETTESFEVGEAVRTQIGTVKPFSDGTESEEEVTEEAAPTEENSAEATPVEEAVPAEAPSEAPAEVPAEVPAA